MAAQDPRNSSTAAFAFGAAVVVAFFVLLDIGVPQGFFLDEWDFIAARSAWDIADLMRPHNEHWSALPILLYRAWYRIFGLDSYVPYRALSVSAHLAAAVAMRLLLRRIGLGPWLASAVVLPWVLFGSGWENIVWGFQAAWSAALVFGVTQLLLADHHGRRDIRDVGGLAAGLAGLMSAGIAVPLTAAVGLSLLIRRGWRVAALHLLPLAGVYGLWSSAFGDTSLLQPAPSRDKATFIWSALSSAVASFSWWRGLGAVLAALVLALVALSVRKGEPADRRRQLAIPIGFALGVGGYLYVVVSGRAFLGTGYADTSRYQHIVTFMLLPLLGAAAKTAIGLARSAALPVRSACTALVLLALWAGVPGNVSKFSDSGADRALYRGQISRVEATAAAVQNRPDLPANGQPLRVAPAMTIGWLREAAEEGVLSATPASDPRIALLVAQSLELLLVDEDPDPSTCRALTSPLTLRMKPGDRVSLAGSVVIADISSATGIRTVVFDLRDGRTLRATEPLRVSLRRVYLPLSVCR